MHNYVFDLKTSLCFLGLIFLGFISSIAVVSFVPIRIVPKIAFDVFIILYLTYIFWFDGLRHSPHSIIELQWRQPNQWFLRMRARELLYEPAVLLPDSTITRWVSILRFKIPGQEKVRSCIVFRDSLVPDAYRRLVMRVNS